MCLLLCQNFIIIALCFSLESEIVMLPALFFFKIALVFQALLCLDMNLRIASFSISIKNACGILMEIALYL